MEKEMKRVVLGVILSASTAFAWADSNVGTAIGGGVGGAAGAAVGQKAGGKTGGVVGGAVGGAAGAAVGTRGPGQGGAIVGGAAGAVIGRELAGGNKQQQQVSKPVQTVAAQPAQGGQVQSVAHDCGKKHNKGKGWAKGHNKHC